MEEENRPSDLIDRATQVEEGQREQALSAVLREARRKPKQAPLEDGSFPFPDCEECGNDIGDGRLRAAIDNTWCIECATVFGRTRKWRA